MTAKNLFAVVTISSHLVYIVHPVVVDVSEMSASSVAYVAVDEVTWKLPSELKAIDVCFKAFHVLYSSYPVETFVWLLLQRLMFVFATNRDINSTNC